MSIVTIVAGAVAAAVVFGAGVLVGAKNAKSVAAVKTSAAAEVSAVSAAAAAVKKTV